MTEEEWRSVPGHPDYEVSSVGRVRSWKRGLDEPRLLKPGIHRLGYIRVKLDNIGYGIHQLVAAAWIGPCPAGKEVDHINNIRNDNRPVNLQYLTRQENMAKMGEKPPRTHCAKGHPLSGNNLYIRPSNGERLCRACQVGYVQARRERLANGPQCSIEDCARIASYRVHTDERICEPHYQKSRRTRARRRAA